MKSVLNVRMLGGEEVIYGGKHILPGSGSSSKTVKLWMLLLHSGEEGIARSRLLEAMYGREEVADAANNLRVTSHRLKKMLVGVGLPEYDYISVKGGIYRWNAPMETRVDALEFKRMLLLASEEKDERKKAKILIQALELYRGEFLPKLSGDEWVLVENARYKALYSEAMEWVSSYLYKEKEYEKLLVLAEDASRIYPLDEWQAVKIDCYIGLNRYEDALNEYEHTAKLLFEELGVTPSDRMLKQFDLMCERMSSRSYLMDEIRNVLREDEKEEGAFYCTAPSFRDAYRIMRRTMERNGRSAYLMLCTITDGNGHCMMESEKLEYMSEVLYHSIRSALRRSDAFTKYNTAQYLILLINISGENCKIVADRIVDYFSREHKTWGKYLECCISSLDET